MHKIIFYNIYFINIQMFNKNRAKEYYKNNRDVILNR